MAVVGYLFGFLVLLCGVSSTVNALVRGNKDYIDKLGDKLVSKFFVEALKVWSPYGVDLDGTMLLKTMPLTSRSFRKRCKSDEAANHPDECSLGSSPCSFLASPCSLLKNGGRTTLIKAKPKGTSVGRRHPTVSRKSNPCSLLPSPHNLPQKPSPLPAPCSLLSSQSSSCSGVTSRITSPCSLLSPKAKIPPKPAVIRRLKFDSILPADEVRETEEDVTRTFHIFQ